MKKFIRSNDNDSKMLTNHTGADTEFTSDTSAYSYKVVSLLALLLEFREP